MTDVKAIAGWTGWCDPCGTERPLSLTETGPRGLLAWLRGVSWEDRELGLYCRCCGQHQVVPLHEAEDPEVVVVARLDLLGALTRVGTGSVVLARPVRAAGPDVPVARRVTRVPLVPAQRVVAARPAITSIVLPGSAARDVVGAGRVA